MTTSSSSDKSIWETLDSIESQLFQSINQQTQNLIPLIVEKSNQLINCLPKNITFDQYSQQQHPLQQQQQQQQLITTLTRNGNTNNKKLKLIIIIPILITSIYTFRATLHSKYYQRFLQTHPNLSNYLPRSLRRVHRKNELLIILGADPGTLAEQLSLHLAQQGIPIIASVSSPEMVNRLQVEGMGWIKPLVLDPLAPQIKPFNRALSASLALRFPLSGSPDTFIQSPTQQHSLVGLINCLPLALPNEIRPIEALSLNQNLFPRFHAIVGLSLEIIKFLLPIIRNSIEKFGAQDALILTLFPTKNSSLALPYLGSSVIANQALETLMVTLRREIGISDSPSRAKIRVVNERIGTFRGNSTQGVSDTKNSTASLPAHLHPIYARSMARRIGLVGLSDHLTSGPGGSPLSHLLRRVERIVQNGPSIWFGSRNVVGAESWTYLLLDRLAPASWIDRWLVIVESLHHWVRDNIFVDHPLHSSQALDHLIEKRLPSSSLSLTSENHPQEIQSPADDPSTHPTTELVTTPAETEQISLETGSVVDHGSPQPELLDQPKPETESLNHSFVGSEIDWNQKP